jgi:chromosome segregation ATPase
VEGFLSLTEAAQQLNTTPDSLSREIAEGRVVAIVQNSESWLSPGEVSRLLKSQMAQSVVPEEPVEEPNEAPQSQTTISRSAPPQPSASEVELRKRYHLIMNQYAELEQVNRRLKTGLQETEAALRRSRNARSNLENDIISLQDELKKSQTRSSALEREVQHLTHELERAEDKHSQDLRRLRPRDRAGDSNYMSGNASEVSAEDLTSLRQQMQEKDRIISQEYQERAVLRSQIEERSQKYYELKARYEKEKSEWSEILARELQTHGQLKSELEELRPKTQKGWNPFRRDK